MQEKDLQTMELSGAERWANKFIKAAFGIVSVIIFVMVVLVDKNVYYYSHCRLETLLPNLVLIPIGGVLCIGFLFWRSKSRFAKRISDCCNQRFGMILILLAGVTLLLQVIYSYVIYFYPGWDASVVIEPAEALARWKEGIGYNYYYSQYPNNLPITYILSKIQRVAFLLNFDYQMYQFCIAAGVLQANLAGVFTALSAKRLTGSGATGIAAYLLFGVIAGFSPWITIPYTDVYSILYPALTFYLYIRACESQNAAWGWWIGVGLSGGFGFLMKPNSGMVLIAIVVMEVVKLFTKNRQKLKRACQHLGVLALCCVLMAGFRNYMIYEMECSINEDIQMGITHYLMMGLNHETTGAYSADDFLLSVSCETREERITKNLQVTAERLQEFGLVGYMKFLGQKLLVNFNDGTFSWGMEGGFMLKDSGHEFGELAQQLRSLFREDGENYRYYATFAQAVWVLMLGWMPWVIISKVRVRKVVISPETAEETPILKRVTERAPIMVMQLSLLGIFAFVMLFESRGRYLYCMLPMFTLCAIMGLRELKKLCAKNRKSKSGSIN